jgi:hypothetical protein
MKRVLIAAALCLALASCRGWKSSGAPEAKTPTQGPAAVQATIGDTAR